MSERTFIQAVNDAADGIARTFREQPNFRIQVLMGALAAAAAILLRFSPERWAILAVTVGLVLLCELFNTCLEHTIDLIHVEPHPLARAAKHAGAGAVLVAGTIAVLVGIWLYAGALLGR
jgi:diacylglycerol kinase